MNIAKKLDKNLFDILLIDKNNYHQFQPLLYQVATAQIEPSDISFPIRYIFKNKKHIDIRLANVQNVDTEKKIISTDNGNYNYDYLVLAMGGKTNFFGNDEISKNAISLKSTIDAIKIRNHFLEIFEKIASNQNVDEALYNIVIVGGGPTGVELSGAFAEIKKSMLPIDFHTIDFSKINIILIEGGDVTLAPMSKKSQVDSFNYLIELGVNIYTKAIVTSYDGNELKTNNGMTIKSNTVIWSAGITANSIVGIPEKSIGHGQRLIVSEINELVNCNDVFVLGDMAYMETSEYPKGHPQLASVAIQQAVNLSQNLKNIENKLPTTKFKYKNKGTMATVGRNKAVVDFNSIHFRGVIAWFTWMFLHLMLILTVKNKIIIFINWTWIYLTKNTALGIIIKDDDKTMN
ncbi:MAG: NAD(P)/FAD-dependent oxidoreductase [Saprospiraceae bacterium]